MSQRRAGSETGFTLIEVLLALGVTAMAMVAISGAFISTLRARQVVQTLTESTEAGERILTLLERDLQGLWHHNIENNLVLRGQDRDFGGFDADRIDFLTSSDAIGAVLDSRGHLRKPSICEVGYWLKENPKIPGLLELWRREDPMVDGNLLTGGHFQLVSDRLKSFNITYYQTLGYQAEEVHEWDSSLEDLLPRRIKIEFRVHRRIANRNQTTGEVQDFEKILKDYTRHIVFDPRMPEILLPGVAMLPLAPPRPAGNSEGGGPAGPGGPGAGGAGPAGPGAIQQSASAGRPGGSGGTTFQTPRGPRTNPGGSGRPPILPTGGNSSGFDLGNILRGVGIPVLPTGSRR